MIILKKRNLGSFNRHMYLMIKKIDNPEYTMSNGFGETITNTDTINIAITFGLNLSEYFNIVFESRLLKNIFQLDNT